MSEEQKKPKSQSVIVDIFQALGSFLVGFVGGGTDGAAGAASTAAHAINLAISDEKPKQPKAKNPDAPKDSPKP